MSTCILRYRVETRGSERDGKEYCKGLVLVKARRLLAVVRDTRTLRLGEERPWHRDEACSRSPWAGYYMDARWVGTQDLISDSEFMTDKGDSRLTNDLGERKIMVVHTKTRRKVWCSICGI